jgi:quercetin dioxygenase-like cupin family protein
MTGRIHQPKVVNTRDAPTYRVGSQLVTLIARAADTNGVYSLFETQTAPGKGVRHYRQQYEDETFWVLEGSYSFALGGQEQTLAAGSYIYVPRGTVHAFTNSGRDPARLLILVTPGGIRERFIAEVGARTAAPGAPALSDGLPDRSRLHSIARKYGIEILAADQATDRPR